MWSRSGQARGILRYSSGGCCATKLLMGHPTGTTRPSPWTRPTMRSRTDSPGALGRRPRRRERNDALRLLTHREYPDSDVLVSQAGLQALPADPGLRSRGDPGRCGPTVPRSLKFRHMVARLLSACAPTAAFFNAPSSGPPMPLIAHDSGVCLCDHPFRRGAWCCAFRSG